jgi:hypothetical protein
MPGRLERTLHVHARVLMGCSSFEPLLRGRGYKRTVQPLGEDLRTHLHDVEADTAGCAQRPGKCPTLRRLLDAFGPRVDMGSTSRPGSIAIDDAPTGGIGIGHETNQIRRRLSSSTSDAHAHRALIQAESVVATNSVPRGTDPQVYSPAGGAGACGATAPPAPPSGRMSIRHPVSLAASRAFCPSRPIAKDSW